MNVNRREIFQAEVGKKLGLTPTTTESSWLIPSGEILRLTRFSGGLEYSTKETRIELICRDSGGDQLIAVGYTGAFEYGIDMDFVGDGTRSLVIRLVNGDSGVLNMTGWWEGVTHG